MKTTMPSRRFCLGAALPTFAQAQEARPGRPLLTIGGKIGAPDQGRHAVFDLARLEALPQKTFSTQTPWSGKPTQFSGPLLRDVLAAVRAQGTRLKAIALNDYKVSIPVADSQKYDVLLALRMNGALMAVGFAIMLGHAASFATNGRQLLELVEQRDFDLILMDIHMPELDGLDAKARIPVIALGADAMNQAGERALAAGIDEFLSKPVQREQLERCCSAGPTPATERAASGQIGRAHV